MTKTVKSPTPKLNAAVPIRFGLLALGATAALCASLFTVDIPQGPVAVAAAVKRAEPVVVRHDTAGVLAQVHVAPGMDVVAGALIAQFDRRQIESELAALRKRIDARRMEIDGLKQEAAALASAGDKSAMRSRIAALEAEAVEADRAIIGHATRVGLLEGQLDRLEIRAPVSGRIVEIAQGAVGTALAAKAPLAIIRPSVNRLQLDVTWPAAAGAGPQPGQAARVWQVSSIGLANAHLGQVESVGGDASEAAELRQNGETRARITLDVTGSSLAEQRDGRVLNVQLVTGSKSLAEHLFAPLIVRRANDKAEGATK